MKSQISVVVGASRGIGLELAKVLLSTGSGDVFATCRTESPTLSELDGQSSTFHAVSGARCYAWHFPVLIIMKQGVGTELVMS